MGLEISVIIPCLNEKESISEAITAVAHELQEGGFRYEIIVVDNGSIDGSDAIAKKLKAIVLFSLAETVAGVRNMGADVAKGKLLVFLDADVVVQPSWGKTFRVIYEDMMKHDNIITGSNCSVPGNIKPLLASWYKGISEDKRDTHLGTGHMVVSVDTFRSIGGFNEDLVTGEDYDFCFRVKKIGGAVVTNPQLVACHLGYPENLLGFALREIWHGEGDCGSWESILGSRVALSGIMFLLLNILMVLSLFFNIKLFGVLLLILIAITLSVNLYKFGFVDTRAFLYRSVVSYVYLVSRGLSLPLSVFKNYRNFYA